MECILDKVDEKELKRQKSLRENLKRRKEMQKKINIKSEKDGENSDKKSCA